MGLLGKAADIDSVKQTSAFLHFQTDTAENVSSVISDFFSKHSFFHCIVLKFRIDSNYNLSDIIDMTACHGAVCNNLPGSNCLVLLPGSLDMELFAHRISRSTDSTVIYQFSAHSFSLAFETIKPYLE
ncbi:MAG: hypothetical protein FWH41_03625 [Treponema sp.]|nr:hypothetical protein [Treponema sp.]